MALIYALTDFETNEILGYVDFNRHVGLTEQEAVEELIESWDDFNKLEEIDSDLNSKSVSDFVAWHNEQWVSQIEEVCYEKSDDVELCLI